MNAETMLRELGTMPSCGGFWPRILPETSRGSVIANPYADRYDVRYEQCRAGIFEKHIDVTTGETLDVLHAWSDGARGHRRLHKDERIVDADIDGDVLTVTTERAVYEWTLRDLDGRGYWRGDRLMPFRPTECPEHTLILALAKGMLGPDLALLADLPCRWAITSREGRPGLQEAIDRIEAELGIHVDEPRDAPEEDPRERILKLLEGTDADDAS